LKRTHFSLAAIVFAAALTFISCFNLVDTTPSPFLIPAQGQCFTVSGSIAIKGAVPEEVNSVRSALPSYPTTSLTYKAEATSGTGSSAVTKTGSVSADHTVYTIPALDADKEWTIKVYVKYGSIEILSASYGIPANTYTADNFAFTKDVYLMPVMDSEVTGTVSLAITIDPTEIEYMTIDMEGQTQKAFERFPTSHAWKTTPSISYSNVVPGNYKLTINCYTSSSASKALLYSTEQTINVVSGLTTNVWEYTGGNGPVKNESGTISFHITAEDLAGFSRTQIYLGANAYNASPSDATANGSIFNPFATFSAAATYINQLPAKNADDTNIEYTIHLKDGYLENLETSVAISIGRNVTVECWKDSPGDKKGIATIKCNNSSMSKMFDVSSNYTFTLDGIKTTSPSVSWSGLVIDGNKAAGMTTCGVYAMGSFKMKGGAVKNCKTSDSGGGVLIWSQSFTMEGGIISANESLGTYYGGGGVYMRAGSFTMTDGEIFGNQAQKAAGLYLDDDDLISHISGGKIYDNHSLSTSSQGGAIQNSGTLFIYGSAVIGDDTATSVATSESHSNSAAFGAGIYSAGSKAKLYIGYSAEDVIDPDFTGGIYHNYASGTDSMGSQGGGAICVYSGLAFKIAGGNISYNYSVSTGGGIKSRMDFSVSGLTMQENETAGQGGAIATTGVSMSGKVVIPYGVTDATTHNLVKAAGKNDVNIYTGKITITDTIDDDTSITLSPTLAYNSRGNEIIAADTGITFDEDTLTHFALCDTDWNLELFSNTSIIVNAPIYWNSTGPANYSVPGTRSQPFGSWTYGVKEAMRRADLDYTVYIDGLLNSQLTIDTDITNDATITGKRYAKSITIMGAHDELDDSGNLQDAINYTYSSHSANNYEIQVSTIVPVTIKNLWIKGAKVRSASGGGLRVQAGAKVTLDEGTLISDNSVWDSSYGGAGVYVAPASGETPAGILIVKGAVIKHNDDGGMGTCGYGGGIFNEGNTYIYGTTVIGGTEFDDENEARYGGGIYNTGCLYLGINETGGNAAWTGGIYCNKGEGGGIYNKADSTHTGLVKMRAGTIAGNYGMYNGGGIYSAGEDDSHRGKVYIYGSTVIGDSTATSVPDGGTGSNYTGGNGGGIAVFSYSDVFLGYSDDDTIDSACSAKVYYNRAIDGGGVYVDSDGCFKMGAGTIAFNKATGGMTLDDGNGGGVKALNFNFYGGLIKQNRCSDSGKGGQIYTEGTLHIKGKAAAEGDAYVSCHSIVVDGALTPVSQNGLAAIVEPTNYGTFSISLGSSVDPATTAGAAYGRFAIVPAPEPTYYGIDLSSGYLKSSGFLGNILPGAPKNVGAVVFSDGSAKSYSSGMTLSAAQKAAAVAVIFYAGTACNNEGDTSTTRYLGVGLKKSEEKREFVPYSSSLLRTSMITSLICYATGSNGSYDFSGAKNGINSYNSVSSSLGSGAADCAFGFPQNYKDITGSNVSGTLFEEGWYLPSVRELYALASAYKDSAYNTTSALRESVELLLDTENPWSSTGSESWYWSSSQANSATSAYAVQFAQAINTYVQCNPYTKSMSEYCLAIHQFY